jgi:hypothetical protein
MKLLSTLLNPLGETMRAVPFREFKGTRGEILLTKRHWILNQINIPGFLSTASIFKLS